MNGQGSFILFYYNHNTFYFVIEMSYSINAYLYLRIYTFDVSRSIYYRLYLIKSSLTYMTADWLCNIMNKGRIYILSCFYLTCPASWVQGLCKELVASRVWSEPKDQLSNQKWLRPARGIERWILVPWIQGPLLYPLGHNPLKYLHRS